jgi:hypothetical protein
MTGPPYTQINLADFDRLIGSATEVSSAALGGRVLSVSDEWFAPCVPHFAYRRAVDRVADLDPLALSQGERPPEGPRTSRSAAYP